jgi:hypothetical protein
MRIMMKVEFPVEMANAAMTAGSMPRTIKTILAEQKPEAAYFLDCNGRRCGYLFLDLRRESDIPAMAEPWFLAFNAGVEIHPAMVPEDLAKASPAIAEAVKKYACPPYIPAGEPALHGAQD